MTPCPKPTKIEETRRRRAKKRLETPEGRSEFEAELMATHVCWKCGRNGCSDPLDKHHIWGGALRSKSERYGAMVYLCHERCHENGEEAVHRNVESARELKAWAQEKLMAQQDWTEDDFIREFGRNYQ